VNHQVIPLLLHTSINYKRNQVRLEGKFQRVFAQGGNQMYLMFFCGLPKRSLHFARSRFSFSKSTGPKLSLVWCSMAAEAQDMDEARCRSLLNSLAVLRAAL
jgi:hypothetical protein